MVSISQPATSYQLPTTNNYQQLLATTSCSYQLQLPATSYQPAPSSLERRAASREQGAGTRDERPQAIRSCLTTNYWVCWPRANWLRQSAALPSPPNVSLHCLHHVQTHTPCLLSGAFCKTNPKILPSPTPALPPETLHAAWRPPCEAHAKKYKIELLLGLEVQK
jgi:hypothetical protein